MKKNKNMIDSIKLDHLDFLAKGLGCHALCLIEYIGVLDIIKKDGSFQNKCLQNYKNPHLIRAALVTLVGADVLSLSNDAYSLTDLGHKLAKNIGAITLPFMGYRGLLEKQFELVNAPSAWDESDIDYSSVAFSSIKFGLSDLDPIILEIFRSIKPKGTICDFGCGTGEKLVKICKEVDSSGLGIEKNLEFGKMLMSE